MLNWPGQSVALWNSTIRVSLRGVPTTVIAPSPVLTWELSGALSELSPPVLLSGVLAELSPPAVLLLFSPPQAAKTDTSITAASKSAINFLRIIKCLLWKIARDIEFGI